MSLPVVAAFGGMIAATIACSRTSPPAPDAHARLPSTDSESVSSTGLTFTDSCGDTLASVSGGLQLSGGVEIHARDGGNLHAARAQWLVRDGTLRVGGPHQWSDARGSRVTPGDGRFALDRAGTLRPQR